MGEKDDGLGLSLSLKFPENTPPPPQQPPPPPPPPPQATTTTSTTTTTSPFPLNLLPSPPFSFLHRHQHHHPPPQTHHHLQNHQRLPFLINHAASHDLNAETRSYGRGIDVNRLPPATTSTAAAAEFEEEAVVSSPNSTVSSVSGKRAEREENDAERDSSSHGVSGDEDDGGDAAAARKKLRLSKDQAAVLEETFKEHNTLNPKQKIALAKQLDLRPRQVEVWFQNRRARTKLKQTEVDCEYLKRCCETLTEENRRLQKEVNELRALKLSPQFYMNMNPPTTLTMCPQCERVAVSSSSTSSSAATTSGATGLGKALQLGPMGSDHQKQNNPFLPRATIIPQRPLDAHHHPRW